MGVRGRKKLDGCSPAPPPPLPTYALGLGRWSPSCTFVNLSGLTRFLATALPSTTHRSSNLLISAIGGVANGSDTCTVTWPRSPRTAKLATVMEATGSAERQERGKSTPQKEWSSLSDVSTEQVWWSRAVDSEGRLRAAMFWGVLGGGGADEGADSAAGCAVRGSSQMGFGKLDEGSCRERLLRWDWKMSAAVVTRGIGCQSNVQDDLEFGICTFHVSVARRLRGRGSAR